ncbi:MAG: Hsp20/alpha crystallin family protein [Planctomycetota bacterium]
MDNCTHKNRLQNFVPGSWNDFDSLLNQVLAPTVARTVRGLRAPLSVWEADDAYHVELDVPGVTKEQIEVTYEKGNLQIVADRAEPETQRSGLHEERTYGKVTRSLSLSESVDPDSIVAELNNGVLHVTVTKVPEAQPRRIDIN